MGYIKDCKKLLLCKVMLGKPYKCPGMLTGKPLQTGFNSHISPCGQELIIFHSDQILPCYIVHYSTTLGGGGFSMAAAPASPFSFGLLPPATPMEKTGNYDNKVAKNKLTTATNMKSCSGIFN
jgi:hypothetical protein